jgi:hypothetical protein
MRSNAVVTERPVEGPEPDPSVHVDRKPRNVRAILIAGDQIGSPGVPTPGAIGALEVIERDLPARFSPAGIEIARLIGRPTKDVVVGAFAAMTAIVRTEELFIVMFAGHGAPATGADRMEAWCLTETDRFTDVDLAAALLELPARVDTVVISACCHGEGVFHVGVPDRRWPGRSTLDAPMVCISGAGEGGLVALTRLANLATQVVAAAAAGQSYRQLRDTFAATAVAGRSFHVDARPSGRLEDPVLGTSPRGPERSCVRPPSSVLPFR